MRRVVVACAIAVAVACKKDTPKGSSATPVIPPPAHEEIAEAIFQGGAKNGWKDAGYCPRETNGPGPAALQLANRGAWIMAKPSLQPDRYGALVLRVKPPKGDVDYLEVRLESPRTTTFPRVALRPEHEVGGADGWTDVRVPFFELDPEDAPFDRVVVRAFKEIDGVTLIDGLALTKASGESAAARVDPANYAAKARPIAVRVACDEAAIPISPRIYGIAYYPQTDDARDQWTMGATGRRFGGNTSTRFNWEKNAWNTGSDWFFENKAVPASWEKILDDDDAHGIQTALTVPMIGWVAKDATSYAFPVAVFGPQARVDPSLKDAGDGTAPTGKDLAAGSPTRTSVAAPPEFIKRWVQAIRERDAKRGKRSVHEYILDNEPMVWHRTHRDVHPEPVGYDELLERTIRYGTAIREADPDAVIAGPAEWGWTGYFDSAKKDRGAHGDVPLVAWYLRKLKEHEDKTGVRVLDVLDLHVYPQAPNIYGEKGLTDDASAALRVRQTRGLWDPTYVDESWIKEPVRLLPRMKEWVEQNHPGRKISIGEWSYGGEGHISGALATAIALGRFAQHGVFSAYYWTHPPDGAPVVQAFLAYRNFDGKGGRFLDLYVPSKSPEPVSFFASRDEAKEHLVAVAVNPSPDEAFVAKLELTGCGSVASRTAYSYMKGGAALVKTTSEVLPPSSITVIDVRLAR